MAVKIPAASEMALRRSLAGFNGAVSQEILGKATDLLLDGIKSILNPGQEQREADGESKTVTVGETPVTVLSGLNTLFSQVKDGPAMAEALNLDFKLATAVNIAQGAARLVSQNFDQAELDEFPALELLRVYDRTVPRGFARGPKGGLIPVPDDDWPSRFKDAINDCDDPEEDKAAMGEILEGGRMIALKSSGVWAELGSNRDDTIGNAYPPFAWNSGYDVDGVPRAECEELGLIDPGEAAEPADVDFEKLFSLTE